MSNSNVAAAIMLSFINGFGSFFDVPVDLAKILMQILLLLFNDCNNLSSSLPSNISLKKCNSKVSKFNCSFGKWILFVSVEYEAGIIFVL